MAHSPVHLPLGGQTPFAVPVHTGSVRLRPPVPGSPRCVPGSRPALRGSRAGGGAPAPHERSLRPQARKCVGVPLPVPPAGELTEAIPVVLSCLSLIVCTIAGLRETLGTVPTGGSPHLPWPHPLGGAWEKGHAPPTQFAYSTLGLTTETWSPFWESFAVSLGCAEAEPTSRGAWASQTSRPGVCSCD